MAVPHSRPAVPGGIAPRDLAATLRDAGWAHVPGALSAKECEGLKGAIDQCRATPGPHFRTLSPLGAPVMQSELFRWRDMAAIGRVSKEGALPKLAAAALDTPEVLLLEDQWFYSEEGSGTRSPWHQDHPYHPLEPWFLTIWVPLDEPKGPVGLRTVAHSHLGPIFAPVEFSAQKATLAGGEFSTEPVPDIDADPARFDVTVPEVAVGDAVLLDSRTLHAAGGECESVFRRISIRYAHPATRIVPRAWSVAEFWNDHPCAGEPGAPLPDDEFPRLRPFNA